MTRTAAGVQTIYVNGAVRATSQLAGTSATWNPSYPLSLANTADGARPWSGTLCLVAIYDIALTPTQVSDNHAAGCARAPNVPPVLDPPAAQSDDEGTAVAVAISATDPDGDTLLYAATNLPDGLSIDPATGSIDGTIGQTAATGSPYAVGITIDDQRGGIVSGTISWVVNPINVDPVLDPIGDLSTAQGQTVAFVAAASDPDNDTLTFQLSGAPLGWSIGTTTGEIAGIADLAGVFPVTVTIDDGHGGSDSETFDWTVKPNADPILDPIVDQASTERESVSLDIEATDPDGDDLAYQATGLPSGLSIDAVSGEISGTVASGAAALSPYSVEITADDGSATASATITWTVAPGERTADVVHYDFSTGSGTTVFDRSGLGTPLDLTISDPSSASWSTNGLTVSGTTIVSPGAATKIFDAVSATNEISVEAWVTPANVTQDGPARIVSLAPNPFARNFMLGQGAWGSQPDDTFASRFRTSSSSSGTPTLFTTAGSASAALTHVVMTRTAAGVQTIYVNGAVRATSQLVRFTSATWNPSFPTLACQHGGRGAPLERHALPRRCLRHRAHSNAGP